MRCKVCTRKLAEKATVGTVILCKCGTLNVAHKNNEELGRRVQNIINNKPDKYQI